MIRNLKGLGLAMAAVLALSAMAAGAAQAQVDDAQLTLEESPAVINGTQTEQHVLTRLGRTVTCETAEFEGEASTGATTIILVPHYTECHSTVLGSTLPATVTVNSCYYVFHLTKDTEPVTYTADADLTCEKESDQIEIHVYTNHTKHTEGVSSCTFTIPQQHGLQGIDLTNVSDSPDYLVAHLDVVNIKSHAHGSVLLCGATENETATLKGTATLKAEGKTGPVGGTVSTDVETK